MIRLLDLAADAATFATEHLLVAAARLHDRVSSLRARLGTPRHCPTCLVVAPRGDACACTELPSAPGPGSPPSGPGAGREVAAVFCRRCDGVTALGPACMHCGGPTGNRQAAWGDPPEGYSAEYVEAMEREHGRDHV